MILEKTPITMAEVQTIVKPLEEKQVLKDYMKKFTKIDKKKADELTKEITNLNNLKLKQEHIVKLIDFLPKDKEELNKLLTEINLSEEETNAILALTGKY